MSFKSRTNLGWCWGLIMLAGWPLQAEAQLFGERQMGGTLSRRPGPGATAPAAEAGTLRNQRFIRGTRGRANFVGADRIEAREFVGMQQASTAGSARSAVAGLSAEGDSSGQVNQPATRPARSRPYPPRLAVGFEYSPADDTVLAQSVIRHLDALPGTIEVSVEGRTATLRGGVPSAAERELAAALVNFEPGISVVINELTVARGKEELPPLPPLPMPD